jgi:hypothetical protein
MPVKQFMLDALKRYRTWREAQNKKQGAPLSSGSALDAADKIKKRKERQQQELNP